MERSKLTRSRDDSPVTGRSIHSRGGYGVIELRLDRERRGSLGFHAGGEPSFKPRVMLVDEIRALTSAPSRVLSILAPFFELLVTLLVRVGCCEASAARIRQVRGQMAD
jgi:hypothetical protein